MTSTSEGAAPPERSGATGMRFSDPELDVPAWTFLTNHAHVLIAISRDPALRQRDIAHVVGITPGAVVRILHDLEENGYVTAERIGRRNRYHINTAASLRHPLEDGHTVGDLIDVLAE
jgi:predicted ArsR family transcriptional regulator